MLRLPRISPVLIGLALAGPATAQSQPLAHTYSADCPVCNPDKGAVPVVVERRGPLGKLLGGTKVTIPAGHHVEEADGTLPGPVAAWTDGSASLPTANGVIGAGDPDAGHATVAGYGDPESGHATVAGNGDPAQVQAPMMAPGAMPIGYGAPAFTPGAPSPIGVMQTNYAPTMPSSPSMAPAAALGMGMAPPASAMQDPAIRSWHSMGLGHEDAPHHPGALSRMFGLSGLTNWVEAQRTKRAIRNASKTGAYAPSMNQMPTWAVNGR